MDERSQIINFLLISCDEKTKLIQALNQRITELTESAKSAVAPPTDA